MRFLMGELVVLLSAALSVGCVGLKQYRNQDRPGESTSYHEVISTPNGPSADLYVVEVDDQGWLMAREELDAATQRLDGFNGCTEAPLIITFVHGWNHNAAYDDQNIVSVRDSLALIAKKVPRRKVVGVYLGWRGKSGWRGPGLLSFWSRKEAAHRIGFSGAAEVFNRLELAKANLVDEWDAGGGRRSCLAIGPQMFVLGHSFGAALTFSAYGQILGERMRVLASIPDPLLREKLQKRWTDLVVLFNPAFEAARTEHLMHIGANCGAQECGKMLMVLTAQTDKATGFWFPLGRWAGTLSEGLQYNHDTEVPQGAANRTAVGHFEDWLTHTVRLSESPNRNEAWCLSLDELKERDDARKPVEPLQADAGSQEFCGFSVARTKAPKLDNPRFMNIRMEKDVANGHAFEANRESVSEFVWDFVMYESQPKRIESRAPHPAF